MVDYGVCDAYIPLLAYISLTSLCWPRLIMQLTSLCDSPVYAAPQSEDVLRLDTLSSVASALSKAWLRHLTLYQT